MRFGMGLAAVAAAALSGCVSMRTPMTDFATDYNRVIADTRNEMILLNIVRASLREPTHYSTLSQVGGNISISGGVNASLGGIIDDIDADASTGLSVGSSPSFQVVPLNTNEFASGVLRPIEPNVVATFLAQGWNEHRLAALLVESVRCGGTRYYNDLRGTGDRGDGRQALSAGQLFGLGFVMQPASDGGDTPVMTLGTGDADMVRAIRETLDDDYRVTIGRSPDGSARFEVRERIAQQLKIVGGSDGPCAGQVLGPEDYELRSVEGVIYYLGEIVRSRGALTGPDGRIVFRLSNGAPAGGAAIGVRHGGQSWYVASAASDDADRTIQTISLINQLLALQTSSESLERSPTTLTVN